MIHNDFALVPIALKDAWTKKLSGVTLKDVKLTTFRNGEKQSSQKESCCSRMWGSADQRF